MEQERKTRFFLIGKVPTKKNRYKISRGRMYQDPEVTAWMDAAYYAIYYPARQIITVPCGLSILFKTDNRSDLDGMTTTIFDLLQKAKVIKNDRQIVELTAKKKELDKKKYYRTEIVIYTL